MINDAEGSSSAYEKSICVSNNTTHSPKETKFNQHVENYNKSDLMKYAEALIEAHGDEDLTDTQGETPTFYRRTTSYSSL